jgi:hypothetical protein
MPQTIPAVMQTRERLFPKRPRAESKSTKNTRRPGTVRHGGSPNVPTRRQPVVPSTVYHVPMVGWCSSRAAWRRGSQGLPGSSVAGHDVVMARRQGRRFAGLGALVHLNNSRSPAKRFVQGVAHPPVPSIQSQPSNHYSASSVGCHCSPVCEGGECAGGVQQVSRRPMLRSWARRWTRNLGCRPALQMHAPRPQGRE